MDSEPVSTIVADVQVQHHDRYGWAVRFPGERPPRCEWLVVQPSDLRHPSGWAPASMIRPELGWRPVVSMGAPVIPRQRSPLEETVADAIRDAERASCVCPHSDLEVCVGCASPAEVLAALVMQAGPE